jgi:phage baseplate assembly protein W
MEYEITLSGDIDFAPSSVAREVLQNARTILNTVLGSVPLERNVGLSWEYVGMPISVAMNSLRVAIYDAFALQEPRAQIISIKFDEVENAESFAKEGVLKPCVRIYIDEEGE